MAEKRSDNVVGCKISAFGKSVVVVQIMRWQWKIGHHEARGVMKEYK